MWDKIYCEDLHNESITQYTAHFSLGSGTQHPKIRLLAEEVQIRWIESGKKLLLLPVPAPNIQLNKWLAKNVRHQLYHSKLNIVQLIPIGIEANLDSSFLDCPASNKLGQTYIYPKGK